MEATTDIRQFLRHHGIPFVSISRSNSERIMVRNEEASPEQLRELGFRLGHGNGSIRYLLYYRGRFCGVMI